ncbi:AAA family ATPase [Nonomuraea sp. NPDC050556]|uniref:AAA family ATPase n=1 Tax=Nonomuraea sp. NPDC050556 TaxID=3364369 RepID=UPI0037AC7348
MKLRILGAVAADGLDLGPRRQRALLARLVLAEGRAVPADVLIDDLWQGDPPAKALLSVQAHVARLRRVLDPEHRPHRKSRVLSSSEEGFRLCLPRADVDAWHFADLLKPDLLKPDLLKPDLLRPDLLESGRVDEALELWQEPVCGEFAGRPWAVEGAERLRALHRIAVERHRLALLESGRPAEALRELEAAVARDPLHADTRRLFALALHRAGRTVDALGVLRSAPAHVPAVRRLEAALLDGGLVCAAEEPATIRLPPPRVYGSRPTFVGREREQEELRRVAATAAATGRGALVLVGGEPLIGKTALVERLAQWLTAEGWAVAWGDWAELPAQLAEQYEQARNESWTPRQAVRALRELSLSRPLLVVLEDLHEADEESVTLLVEAARETARMVIVTTYRSTERGERMDAALARLALREPYRMVLGGLADEAIGLLIQRPIGRGTVAGVSRRTGGHPFYVRELARMITEEGEGAARHGVPEGVRDALRHRVSGLSPEARRLLDRAAVLGIERAVDEPGEAIVSAAEELLAAGLIVEAADGSIGFAVPLVGEALLAGLSATCRRHIAVR